MEQLLDLKDDIEEGKDQFKRLCDKFEVSGHAHRISEGLKR